jgi:Fic family protein
LYQSDATTKQFTNFAAKEVYSYAALQNGYQQVKKTGLLINNHVLEIQQSLVGNNAGFRKIPGTMLKNDSTGEVVYTPPQDESQIRSFMNNLEEFINDDTLNDADPLIKMRLSITNLKTFTHSTMAMAEQVVTSTFSIWLSKGC